VIYANGAPDDIRVRHTLRAGSTTRPLDLKGRQRAIRRIDLVYRARPSFRGRATVCAEGLDQPARQSTKRGCAQRRRSGLRTAE
jgi:hypothetical protein